MLASPSIQGSVEASGLEFRPFRHGPNWGSHLGRRFDAEYLRGLQCGAGVGQDLDEELALERADVLVVDFMLWGALANAERSGVPTAAFVHTLYQVNRDGVEGAIWDEQDLTITNQTRAALGLRLIETGAQLWDAVQLVLVLLPKAFDRPAADLPENVRYVGPVIEPEPDGSSEEFSWPQGHQNPLVLVSFSTTYMAQEGVLQKALDALAGLPIRGLVTTGPSVDPKNLNPPANTVVRTHIDHQSVLPGAAAVITHAGLGTVIAALRNGVPLLYLPMGRDQGANSKRVEACGAGRVLGSNATVEEIREGLVDLLESPGFRQGARRMADLIKREADGSMVVPLLESLQGL